jgi:hypothetical protein
MRPGISAAANIWPTLIVLDGEQALAELGLLVGRRHDFGQDDQHGRRRDDLAERSGGHHVPEPPVCGS